MLCVYIKTTKHYINPLEYPFRSESINEIYASIRINRDCIVCNHSLSIVNM